MLASLDCYLAQTNPQGLLHTSERWPVGPSFSSDQSKNLPFYLRLLILFSSTSPVLLLFCSAEDQKLLLPEWQQVGKKKTSIQVISSCEKNIGKLRDEIWLLQPICAAALNSCWCKSWSGLADVGCCPPTRRSCPHGSFCHAASHQLCCLHVRWPFLRNPTAACRARRGSLHNFSTSLSYSQTCRIFRFRNLP